MKLEPQKKYIVGIDPGAKTGIAVYDRSQDRITMIKTSDFFGVVPWLSANLRLSQTKAYVEVPAKFLYARRENEAESQKLRDRRMFLSGGVYRESRLLAKAIGLAGIEVEEVLPVRAKKWDQYQFQAATKVKRTANEHEIDAARLAMWHANKRKELTNGK